MENGSGEQVNEAAPKQVKENIMYTVKVQTKQVMSIDTHIFACKPVIKTRQKSTLLSQKCH